jgi:AcrR family transcriptional regulator
MAGGLTARHTAQTRRDLVRAAARLFLDQGYAATTVHEIAEAADVSERTFFRYFPSKEDVVTAIVSTGTDDIISELAAHPELEVLGDALRQALHAVLAQVRVDLEGSRAFRLMLRATPALRGRWLEEQRCNRDRLAEAMRPWFKSPRQEMSRILVAGMVQLALESTLDLWVDRAPSADPSAILDRALAQLDGPLLATRRT